MTKEEALIYAILETFRGNVYDLACAVSEMENLLFLENKSIHDILISKDVYPVAAKKTHKKLGAATKQIERIANLCWNHLNETSRLKYIGREMDDIHTPSDMIFYLAYYCHYGKSYHELLKDFPELLKEQK